MKNIIVNTLIIVGIVGPVALMIYLGNFGL